MQSPYPVEHAMPQVPLKHAGVLFGTGAHVRPHVPQFVVLDVTSTQTPLQVMRPAPVQGIAVHEPLVHVEPDAQAFPQRPQFVKLARSVSHPSAGLPLQLPKPASQATPHDPPVQLTTAWTPEEHAFPHAPQFATLDVVSTQVSPQSIRPVPEQIGTQVPAEQFVPAPQTLLHRPQLLLSALMFTHVLPQSMRPVPVHVGTQLPATQVAREPQGLSHRPQ